jgi:hypothetical protein
MLQSLISPYVSAKCNTIITHTHTHTRHYITYVCDNTIAQQFSFLLEHENLTMREEVAR